MNVRISDFRPDVDSFAENYGRLNLVGSSSPFLRVMDLIKKVSQCDATVLIQGETGTGKELVARSVHYMSARRNFPFIPVNCGAIVDSLTEKELYGHEKGAFTDAREHGVGLIAQAQGGTLFLDEVQTMSARAQVALLRFLQDYEYRPVGSKRTHNANVRIIASSNVDLKSLVKSGLFRQDLLFRLDLLAINLPPLRERPGDAFLLAENFVERFSHQYQQPVKRFDSESLIFLNNHDWPGNVRELENLIHREFLLTEGQIIKIKGIKEEPKNHFENNKIMLNGELAFKKAKARAIAEFEKAYLSTLLLRTQGNISLAAKLSGKERSALGKLVKKYGLERQQFLQPKQLS